MREGTYQFSEFCLDAGRFQLRRGEEEVRLEKKPLELLLLLAASQGRLVTRAEIAAHLWGKEVFVDTEHGINTAMRKVRAALGETSETPRFVQTVPGMGYRFLATVTALEPMRGDPLFGVLAAEVDTGRSDMDPHAPVAAPAIALATAPGVADAGRSQRVLWRWGIAAAVCLLAVALAVLPSVRKRVFRHAEESRTTAAGRDAMEGAVSAGAADHLVPDEVREQYGRGLYLLDRRNAVGSTAAFRRVIELAPDYAPAYAGLAEALDAQAKLSGGIPGTDIPEAVAAAKHAIALDPNFDGGYVALGMIQTAFTWEWADAERNLKRGLELNPQNSTGRIWYAVLLQGTGRREQAIVQARLAVEAAPLSFFMVRMRGSILYFAHRYDEAMRVLARAEEMTPQHPNVVDNWIALVDEQRGLYDSAVQHETLSLQQHVTQAQIRQLRAAYEKRGWKGYWRARLQMMPPASQQGCQRYMAGVAALRVGERDQAFEWLRMAAEQHCFWLGMVYTDPSLDSLRGDPRFSELGRLVYGGDARP